jgi:hypothetical protein
MAGLLWSQLACGDRVYGDMITVMGFVMTREVLTVTSQQPSQRTSETVNNRKNYRHFIFTANAYPRRRYVDVIHAAREAA